MPKQKEKLETMMEDFALERVPHTSRRPWMDIASVQVGLVTSLAILLVGGLVTFMAGFWLGALAALISFVVSTFFQFSMGSIGYKEGYSSNIVSRAYAFGKKGSVIAALIWSSVIIGLLGLESILIGESILFYFDIERTLLIKVIMYVTMAALWIVLSLFGSKIVARVSQILVPLLFAVLIYIVYLMVNQGSFSDIFTSGAMFPGITSGEGFAIAMNATITMAGLSTIVLTDFTRFARSRKDVLKVSVTTGFTMYGVTMFFGAVITYFGYQLTQQYFISQGMVGEEALNAAINNPGITLVLAGGFVGILAIVFSQAKVQVGNSSEAALSLVNLFESAFNWKPGRAYMVIFANILSFIFIFGNIHYFFGLFLTFASVLLAVWVTIVITDYYVVKGKFKIGVQGIGKLEDIQNYNVIGIVTLIISSGVGLFINYLNLFSIPFIISVVLAFVMYLSLSLIANSIRVSNLNKDSENDSLTLK